MQHRMSSTPFLTCRKLGFRSLITLPCGFLFERWLLDQVVRNFPQTTLDGIPKLSQVPQRAGGTCVWAPENGLQGQVQVQTQHMKMPLSPVGWMGSVCPPWRPELCSQTPQHNAAWRLQGHWLCWQWVWLPCLGMGRQGHFAHSRHPHQLNRKGTQEPYSSPGLCNRRAGRTSLAWSISAGSNHCVLATESSPQTSPLSPIREKMPNLHANIYTLTFKCRCFSLHGESWPWCFLFIFFFTAIPVTIELLVSQSKGSHIPPLFILPNDNVPLALWYHHFSSSSEVNIKSSPLAENWIWQQALTSVGCRKKMHHLRMVTTSREEKPSAVPVCLVFCMEHWVQCYTPSKTIRILMWASVGKCIHRNFEELYFLFD